MDDKIIVSSNSQFDSQYNKLNDDQRNLVDYYKICLETGNPCKLGNYHELKQFNHRQWKVYSNDIPKSKIDISALKLDLDYYRGSDRFVYETITTSDGRIVYNLINCVGHRYKNRIYSELNG